MLTQYNSDQITFYSAQDEPPIGLTRLQAIFLEMSMLSGALIMYFGLFVFQAPITTLVLYILVTLITLPYIYEFFLTEGKRILNYYTAGEFIFKKEFNMILFLETLLTTVTFFILTVVLIDCTKPYKQFHQFFNRNLGYETALVASLFVVALPSFEEFYWRCFLVKSLPSNLLVSFLVAMHYGLICLIVMTSFIGWEISLIAAIFMVLWHIILVYIRRLQKFSTVLVLGYAQKVGVYSAFYLMFVDTAWYNSLLRNKQS